MKIAVKSCCSNGDEQRHNHLHINEHSDDHSHDHSHAGNSVFSAFGTAIFSFVLLITGIALDNWWPQPWFVGWVRLVWYIVAYLPVGLPVLKDAVVSIKKGDVYSEFFLMGIATVGAFVIGEYPEGVAVMLFYTVGETFQSLAVQKAKNNIQSLIDKRPDEVTVIEDGVNKNVKAAGVQIGTTIQLKAGEQLALDGKLLSASATFNAAALTGESQPDNKVRGDKVFSGMINLNTVSFIEVTAAYKDSKLSRILDLVQNANTQKAPTELFIRRFARVYTPIVVYLAIGICVLPVFFVADYVFKEWLYKALVFLVISCPCALVISIPLGYFGGIGAASRNGLLVKGGNFLDILAQVRDVVMDKTGTLTEGAFEVKEVVFNENFDYNFLLQALNELESHSSHPVATAIHNYVGIPSSQFTFENIEEVPGNGLKAILDGKVLLAGNFRLLKKFGVSYDVNPDNIVYTTLAIAYDGLFAGYIVIADKTKQASKQAIADLKALNVHPTMLSGDKDAVVQQVAAELGIADAYGDLLPEDKVDKLKQIKADKRKVAFVGDGINDAPVLALSDVGIAMGGLGSDAAIETADVVIQDDNPGKIVTAIKIGKQTKKIVWQNVGLAFGVKAVVLILGAGGLATMWEAVFADVGVALLAILNAVRIQSMRFK